MAATQEQETKDVSTEKGSSAPSSQADESGPVDMAEQGPVRSITGIRWFLVVSGTLSSIFLYALDNTIVADIVPAIVNDFQSIRQLPWLSVGFALGGLAFCMPWGRLYGLFDAKWLYIASTILFMAASALCGGAPNMDAEIVGRVLAGVGGNGMYLGVMTLLSVNTSNAERPFYLSLVGVVWGCGTVIGPVVGGAFELYTWRFAFYLNLLVGAVFAPVYLFLLPNFSPAHGTPIMDRLRKLDWIGMTLSILGFVFLIMAINFGGVLYDWNSAQIIAFFVIGLVAWIAFIFQQIFTIGTTKDDRVFPMDFFLVKEYNLLFLTMAAGGVGFIAIFYIPILFIFTRGDSGLEAAVRLLPLICFISAAILTNGALMGRLGFYKPWYVVGSAILLVGGVLLSRVTVDTPTAAIYGFEILVGVGAGCFVQSGYAVMQALAGPANTPKSLTFMMVAQLSGIGFALSISGALFLNDAETNVAMILPQASKFEVQQLIAGTSEDLLRNNSPQIRAAILEYIVTALGKTYIPLYAGAALTLLCGLFMKNKKMFG